MAITGSIKNIGKRHLDLLVLTFSDDFSGEIEVGQFLGVKFSRLASSRLQLKPAIQAAIRLGLNVKIMSLHASQAHQITSLQIPRACLIGKLSASTEFAFDQMQVASLAALALMRRHRVPTALIFSDNKIYCDDCLGSSSLFKRSSGFYRDLTCFCSHIVFASESMRILFKDSGIPVLSSVVIEDPWSVSEVSYRQFNPQQEFQVVWFGNAQNARYLHEVFRDILSRNKFKGGAQLTVISGLEALDSFKEEFEILSQKEKHLWNLRLVLWDVNNQPAQLEEELFRAHLVLIPSDPEDPFKVGASHNRLTDSIRSGCLVVASPLPSYKELSKLALLGNDFPHLINAAYFQYNRLSLKYSRLRDSRIKRFSPEVNQGKWRQFILKLLAGA